jgi:hypothetical protein
VDPTADSSEEQEPHIHQALLKGVRLHPSRQEVYSVRLHPSRREVYSVLPAPPLLLLHHHPPRPGLRG